MKLNLINIPPTTSDEKRLDLCIKAATSREERQRFAALTECGVTPQIALKVAFVPDRLGWAKRTFSASKISALKHEAHPLAWRVN
jgi:hypothetical protein